MTVAVTTDEIYKRYRTRRSGRSLRLEHEIADVVAGGAPVAQPTGHPLGTIFLLKYGSQAPELQEGVVISTAAPGTPSSASSERLGVDPAEVFGTNCIAFAGADEAVEPRLARPGAEDPQPRLVVVMGVRMPSSSGTASSFQLSQPVAATLGELQSFTPTIEALVVPDIDLFTRRAACEDTLLERLFAGVGPLVGRVAALTGSSSRLSSRGSRTAAASSARFRPGRVAVLVAVLLMPWAMSSSPGSRCRFGDWQVELAVALGCFVVAALVLSLAGAARVGELRQVRRGHGSRLPVSPRLRSTVMGGDRRLRDPMGRCLLGLAWSNAIDHGAPSGGVHEAVDRFRRSRRKRCAARAAGSPSSSRCSSARARGVFGPWPLGDLDRDAGSASGSR